MEKINIAELLKDCPKGMELDCTSYDNVSFDKISEDKKANYPIFCYITDEKGNRISISFTEYGCESKRYGAKCVIFPKGKTTWEGFHKPFNNGDIIYLVTENGNEYITIFENAGNVYLETYIDFAIISSKCSLESLFYIDNIKEQRLATEKEKEKLFQAIKDNGYEWNDETKTLEKLVSNKFDINTLKPFDKVLVRDENTDKWTSNFWGFYDVDNTMIYPYECCGCAYHQCIPYKGNEYLLGTINDCDEYYKTWK